jgi:hypothetical protein
LLGLALSWAAFAMDRRRRESIAALWLFVSFPIVMGMLRGAKYYDGVRHLLFLVPAIVTLAAVGWQSLVSRARGAFKPVAIGILAVGLSEPLVFQLRNHPNQVVYFNALVGGPRGVYPRLELDYWGNCMLQSTRWSAELARQARMPVTVWGNPPAVAIADAERFRELYFSPLGGARQHHLDIRLLRGPEKSVLYFASRPDVLHTVRTADGTPLCVTIAGPRYPELESRLRRFTADR